MEIGIDVLDIDRMSNLIDKKTFLNKFFSNKEISYILACDNNKAQVMAGYYSVKEAFLKALGLGIGRGIDLKEISVEYDNFGKPHIILTDNAMKVFNEMGFHNITISITDSKEVAVAVCIVY